MKIKCFRETDTLYIEFRSGGIAETRDLDENTQLDLDADGNICALTMEHASARADVSHCSFEGSSEQVGFRHSSESWNPLQTATWTPAFAGVTACSEQPEQIAA